MVCLTSLIPAVDAQTTTATKSSERTGIQVQVMSSCLVEDRYFEEEVWAKVGERTCLKCHHATGEAAESQFVLSKSAAASDPQWCIATRKAFEKMATAKEGDESRLLLKVTGQLEHGGGEVLKRDSSGYRILANYVRRLNKSLHASAEATGGTPSSELPSSDGGEVDESVPFFEGVTMISSQRLLRRLTLSLCGRLPTAEERERVAREDLGALDAILDAMLREDAFYERLKEGFNDIFLTVGVDDNAETILSYDHFEHTRLWYQKFPLDDIPESERERKRWKLADVYREAMLREPLELIAHIVRNDLPFSQLATADYIMVSPYTARGYGIFDDIKDQFQNPDDPFEFIPAKLKALKGRNGKTQESPTGMYPHAGFLSMFHYLRRYPSTETNRNRLRARMFYQHFLGIDIMQLAPRSTDASAVAAKYEIPTMQAPDCVVCHTTIDPVAGIFQDFDFEGHLGPRKTGWYTDMFNAGFEGEELPADERWRAPQWLAERAVKDARFPIAMVEHVYYLMFGRKVLQAPEDIDDPLFSSKRRAHRAQRQLIESAAAQFVQSEMNLKAAFKALALSEFYRADSEPYALASREPYALASGQPSEPYALASGRPSDPNALASGQPSDPNALASGRPSEPYALASGDPNAPASGRFGNTPGRRAELDDIGVTQLIAPEQMERKLEAIFGKRWGRFEENYRILYGGIDSKTVTERSGDPSGAMGAIQRMMANDMACKNVALDFRRAPADRLLFPHVEPTVVPGNPMSDQQLLQAIVYLHERILGQEHGVDHPEVKRTFALFVGIIDDARSQAGFDNRETYFCGGRDEFKTEDPHYTIRAWRGVLTYLLRQHAFLVD